MAHFPYTSPVWGASPPVAPPTKLLTSLCISWFQGYWYVIWGIFPYCWGLGGVPHLLGVLGPSAHGMSICSFLYIFVVRYVSCFYYSYNYYSSSYGGIFWPVFGFISDHGSFPDRTSSKLGSVWMVQPSPLMLRGSRGVIGSACVPQQWPPSLMPLLAYANYPMGSPQVGFFFRGEPPTILYIICLVSVLCVCFLLLGAELDAIFTYRGSTVRVLHLCCNIIVSVPLYM